jgi:hypothetical protein
MASKESWSFEIQALYEAFPIRIDKREIRGLLLDPVPPGDRPGEIIANLSIISLDDGPDFDALSYSWSAWKQPVEEQDTKNRSQVGFFSDIRTAISSVQAFLFHGRVSWSKPVKGLEGTTQRFIRLSESVKFPIGENCWQALFHHRNQMLSYRPIWVDAICINQKDNVEKATQLSLMRDIYKFASTTYVWLGPSTKQTDRAIYYLSSNWIRKQLERGQILIPAIQMMWTTRKTPDSCFLE